MLDLWRQRRGACGRARFNHHWLVPSAPPAHRPRPTLATPLIVAAVAARTLFAARPETLWTRPLAAGTRPLRALPIAGSRIARAPPESRALSARRAISHWRTISARRTATRGPIAGRPVARRARSAAIETWGSRWPSGLLPSCWINLLSIAAPSFLRSARQHPAFASFGQLSSGQIGIAAERIEPTAAPAESGAPARAATTATAGTSARTTATAATRTARTATSTAAAAIPIAAIPIAATRIRIAPTFGPRHHVRHVVEFAFLLSIGRRLVTRQDAHQAHPGRALAHYRERLHQA